MKSPIETTSPFFSLTQPDVLLRLEALAELTIVCMAYGNMYSGKWIFFALLFLTPDIVLLGYALANKRFAAALYNIVHSYVLPVALGLWAWRSGSPLGGELALIWLAHIAFDRLIGFGLKLPAEFRRTHIQTAASS
jgi:hypothetical protein